jgi:hypothetical protein
MVAKADRVDGAVASIDSPVLVKDLTDAHQNPNIPRSIFGGDLSDAALADEGYNSLNSSSSKPGAGWVSKSISVKAVQMKTNFDADGETGTVGDWVVYYNGHYMVVKDGEL